MAKEKATISLDRERAAEAQRLTGASSTSAAIDLALRELIRSERLRQDAAAYALHPVTDDEIALSRTPINWSDLDDDTNWDNEFRGNR